MSRMDPEDARQGRKGTPVLRVLIAGLVLIVLAGIVIAFFPWANESVPDAGTGAGLGAPSSTATPPTQGNSTVTPQTSGPSSSGDTQN